MDETSVDIQHIDTHETAPFRSQPILEQENSTSSAVENDHTGSTYSQIEISNARDSVSEQSVPNSEKDHDIFEDSPPDSLEKSTSNMERLSIQGDSGLSSPVACRGPEEYQLKWITWHDRNTPIVTQNQNGPCPLIAIANILLLRGKMKIQANASAISAEDLVTHVANNIVESRPEDNSEDVLRNFEQNMHDAMSLLPQLHTGLDVNIKFTGVNHFEFTEACTVFDLLNISLYHGWVVDPQSVDTVCALGNMGYNQLVEMIIQDKTSDDFFKATKALLAEQFLETSASQLTYHGLYELNSVMSDNELAVLFRNNHFSTIYKRRVPSPVQETSKFKTQSENVQNELFLLVTDQGFLDEHSVVWEMLCNIEGDSMFVDSSFKTVPPKASSDFTPAVKDNLTKLQIDQDYMVALALQEDMQHLDESWEDLKKVQPDEDISETLDDCGWRPPKKGSTDVERTSRQQHQQFLKSTQGGRGCSCSNVSNEDVRHRQSCPYFNSDTRRQNPSGSPTSSSHKKNTCSVL